MCIIFVITFVSANNILYYLFNFIRAKIELCRKQNTATYKYEYLKKYLGYVKNNYIRVENTYI